MSGTATMGTEVKLRRINIDQLTLKYNGTLTKKGGITEDKDYRPSKRTIFIPGYISVSIRNLLLAITP